MDKIITNQTESAAKIRNAVRLITEPVVGTLSPLGANVIYEDSKGGLNLTNDGVTIAKQVSSSDPVENAIIEIIKHGALKTNAIAGDGTTTTTLLTSVLIKEGLKLIDEGHNPMVLKMDMEEMAARMIKRLKPVRVKSSADLRHVARISANGDDDIAKDVVDVVKTAGEDGIVLIEPSNKDETILEKDTGFIVDGGLYSQEYAQDSGFTSTFEDCHVLVTDKRLYYEEEADSIIRTAIENNITKLVIVARDFIGKSVNVFSANQMKNPHIDLMLIKDPNATENDNSSLQDLAIYLGGELVTEKTGKLVNNLTAEMFCEAKRVHANPQRCILVTKKPDNEKLKKRIEHLKKEKDKDEDDKEVERRLAALTSGMVTVRVGGATQIEVMEKIYRYEDAINASRSAKKHGVLPGGGLAILGVFNTADYPEKYRTMARRMCEAPIRQIASNCGEHEEFILSGCNPEQNFGFNAKTAVFEDLVKAGVIDPYKVTEMAIKNAASVAGSILSANWLIVNDKEENDD